MKLSLSLFVITLALSATTTAYGAEAVTGAVGSNGVACGLYDSGCTGELEVLPGGEGGGPDGEGGPGGGPGPESYCPNNPSDGGGCGDVPEGAICGGTNTRFKCTNGVFRPTTDDVGAGFTDKPTAAPKPPCTDAKNCSGEAVIMKDAEETDVSGIDIGIDDSAASSTAIVSSIVGITAAVGVVALL